ncbi:MAG TPA: extracellular solute-binding protein [Ilumatobacter sp.]|nr:extracellular solute-binding protein [Ilumatobacter sp.]
MASLITLAVVAAACGGDDDDAADATAATAAAADTGAPATTPAPATPEATGAPESTDSPETTDATAPTAAPSSTEAAGADAEAALAELVAAAQADGECTIYSSQSLDNLNNFADAFSAKYPGIDVTVVRATDADSIPRVETELSTNTAGGDLVVMASTAWVVDHAADYVDPTASPQIAGLGDYNAELYVHDNYFEVGSVVLTFGWNTELVPDGINDMEDLLDPALAGGKLGVIDAAIAPAVVDFWLWIEENFGTEFVDALAAQEPRIYPGGSPIVEALASGEIFATPYASPAQLVPAAANGAPVDFGISERGAWGAKYFGFIPRSAAHPACATLLADFMVTAEGQAIVVGIGGTVIPGVEGSLITNDMVRNQDLEATAPGPVAEYVAYWDSLFR